MSQSQIADAIKCFVCKESVDESSKWFCNSCKQTFHRTCVSSNSNINSWRCPNQMCNQLKVPSKPKSHKSRKSVISRNSEESAKVKLQLIDEEAKLLAEHRKQKEKLLAEAEQTLKDQQVKELELLKRKGDLIKTLSERGSNKDDVSQEGEEKVKNWKIPEVQFNQPTKLTSTPKGNIAPDHQSFANAQPQNCNLSKEALAARHVVDVKLPKFDGNPLHWQRFFSKFTSTTIQCNITPSENMDRLSSSLIGSAMEAVKSRLYHPDNLESVLNTLKRIFGRDDLILNAQIEEMQKLRPKMEPLDSVVEYALSIQNIAETMNNMGSREHLQNLLLLKDMVEKLPPPIKLEWAEYRSNFSTIDIEVFSNWFFEKAMKITEVMGTIPKFGSGIKQKPHSFLNFHEHQTSNLCIICQGDCKNVQSCGMFNDMSVSKRWEEVKSKHLCRTCLKLHGGRCKSNVRCNASECTARHNPLLHSVNTDQKQNADSPSKFPVNAHNHKPSQTLFKYVPITLYGAKGAISTYAFLDDGSSVTVIEQSLADELGVVGKAEPLCLKWTSNESKNEDDSQRVIIEVRGKLSPRSYYLNARTVSLLDLPKQTISKTVFERAHKHIQNLPIDWYENVKPRVLIGLDNAKLTLTNDVRVGTDDDNVIAGLTKLGWTLYGANYNGTHMNRDVFHICDCAANAKLLETVESYIVEENLNVNPTVLTSKDDERALQIMKSTTKYINGAYETGLIWKFDDIKVPLSYSMAKRRLICLERRLEKDSGMAAKLDREIQSYISKGYAKKLNPDQKFLKSCWYLPIFLVTNPNKPEKIRLVWDAAAKVGNVSLNHLLLKGPDLLSSLPGILCRFRQRQVAITGDISEMFHQIKIRSDDTPFQRFLYRSDPTKEPDVYEMAVMIFGACCSPTSAQYVKNLNAERFNEEHPRACQSITQNHYVDDMLDSVDSEAEAIQLAKEVRKIHASGGFHIRGWTSNRPSVTAALENNAQTASKNLDVSTNTEKVLGMWWDTCSDNFTFSLKLNKGNKELFSGDVAPTKREVLKIVMSVFDPLGLLSHFMVYAKILLQEIWREKTDWDTKITDSSYTKWNEWLSMLRRIEEVKLPRCYGSQFCNGLTEIHVFVDASESAYAAAAYARIQTSEGIKCVLVTAKTRVCPLKGLTVPRMELNAAVLGCRLSQFIRKSHNIEFESFTFWSDSTTVLSWLNSDNRNYNQYVSSRVAEILISTKVSEWRWIPTEHNVADLATKLRLVDMSSEGSWFNGPHFLHLPKEDWPDHQVTELSTNEEIRSKVVDQINFLKVVQSPEDHSTWRPLLRSRAFVCRYVYNVKASIKNLNRRSGRIPTQADLNEAEMALIKQSQRESFPDEISDLMYKNPISKSSSLYPSRPYLSNEGLLMSKGRVYDTIILDRCNHITKLIMLDYHRRYHHHLHEIMVNELMQRFKIARLRVACNSIVRNCQKCKNDRAKPKAPPMADLPSCRLQPFTRPFSFIGIDYFGPINVVVGRSSQKRYGVLITCLTVRAVHIEVAHSLNTDSCILALKNFMNRRGSPIEIFSDNAKNFAGSSKELRDEYLKNVDREAIAEHFISPTTKWSFIPPASPHMGGAWERLVRSVKNTLQRITLTKKPSDELLLSMMIEIEHIVNTRPLTYIPLENEHSEVITPNHFLLGSSNGVRKFGNFSDEGAVLFKNWKRTEQFSNSFQKRWMRDYLPSLNKTPKWRDPVRELKVGDLVLIFDDKCYGNTSRTKGIVTDVQASKDGHIRRATVKTCTGVYVRPASKLAILDVMENPKSDSMVSSTTDCAVVSSGGSVTDSTCGVSHSSDAPHNIS